MIEAIRKVKKVIISGGVAVGKSSIIDSLTNYLKEHNHKYIHIPEYIDVKPDALDMLNKYLTKQISAFEFQEYVTNFYNEYLSTLKINGDEILIFERGPDDGITCFSNLDYNKGNMTEQEFFKLYNLALSYDKKFNLPSYFNDDNKIFIPIKTQDAERDGNIIGSIITNRNNNNIIIGLYNSNDICYNRMLLRNRKGEKEAYTKEIIADFNYTYTKLYKIIMSNNKINIISLGSLIRDK